VTDMNAAPKTKSLSYGCDGNTAVAATTLPPPGVPRDNCNYRTRCLRIRLSPCLYSVPLLQILIALTLVCAAPLSVQAQDAANDGGVNAALEVSQTTYDPLAAAYDLFASGADTPRLWIQSASDVGRAQALLARFDAAPGHGLSPSRYDSEALRGMVDAFTAAPDFEAGRALERAFSIAYLRYASDLVSGMIDPEDLEARVHVDPARADLGELLKRAANAPDVEALLDGLEPTNMRYRHLRAAVQRMMEQVRRGGWGETVDPGGLAPAAVSANVAKLRRRLMAMGDLAPEPDLSGVTADPDIAVYDERLMGAVAAFQQRHGLTADGIVGPDTLRALNAPLGMRLAQAMLNLERMRWRQGQMHGRRIEVNQPDFRMTVFDDASAPVHDARVVIGQTERRLQTPEFNDYMSYIVLNPTWTVPKSIIRREILPDMQKDPGFLERNNMMLLKGGKKVDPASVDWKSLTRKTVAPYSVVQRPGQGNALGNVKFMFPNGYNVYLHDTPSKHLFASDSRAYSHGCVRVERPFSLAWLLLSDQVEDPGTMIDETLATGKETNIPLERPIPITLLYLTSWVDEAGVLNFREDVYKRDEVLARALRANS